MEAVKEYPVMKWLRRLCMLVWVATYVLMISCQIDVNVMFVFHTLIVVVLVTNYSSMFLPTLNFRM